MEVTSSQVETIIQEKIEPKLGWFNRWFPFLQWSPSSPQDLKKAEEELLQCEYTINFVNKAAQMKTKV